MQAARLYLFFIGVLYKHALKCPILLQNGWSSRPAIQILDIVER